MSRRAMAIGVVAILVVAFVALNMVASTLLRGVRIDATQGRVYTLTAGSRNIARGPDEPITLTFYYTPRLAQGQPRIQAHAQRIRELLQEYARVSHGKVRLAVVDPEPFTDAEDRAVADGLQGVPVGPAGSLYFGLVGVNAADGKEIIPFFDPEQERLAEYEISRIIYSLAHPRKKVVGLITPLQMEGGFTFDPRTRQPTQTPPWRIADEMKSAFDIRNLGIGVSRIPDDIDALVVVHPRGLTEPALYAIDQYVMRGGRLLLFTDPVFESDPSAPPMAGPREKSSDLNRLLNAWGVEVPTDYVAADKSLALRVRFQARAEPQAYVVWIDADEKVLSREDVITASLARVMLPTPGFIRPYAPPVQGDRAPPAKPALAIQPIITTSAQPMAVPVASLGLQPDPESLMASYAPAAEPLTLAARLTGAAPSAFPDGPPPPPQGQEAPKDAPAHLAASSGPVNVIVIADVDMLMDQFWVRRENVFGMQMVSKFRDNGALALAALDNLAGSTDLIAVRARRDTNRPFTVVETMQRRAEERFAAEGKLLEEKIRQTQQRLAELDANRPDAGAGRLEPTPEQEAEKAKLIEEFVKTRKDLRNVRLNLRRDIESLGTQLKAINIGLVPLLVTIGAVGLLLTRGARSRRARSAAAHGAGRT